MKKILIDNVNNKFDYEEELVSCFRGRIWNYYIGRIKKIKR